MLYPKPGRRAAGNRRKPQRRRIILERIVSGGQTGADQASKAPLRPVGDELKRRSAANEQRVNHLDLGSVDALGALQTTNVRGMVAVTKKAPGAIHPSAIIETSHSDNPQPLNIEGEGRFSSVAKTLTDAMNP